MPLSELSIKKLAPKDIRYMVRDDRGLYLEVHPNGHKFWKIRYKIGGKEKKLSLGEYPFVSLKDARAKRDEFLVKRNSGQDPSLSETPGSSKFKDVAQEWFETHIQGVRTDAHAKTVFYRLNRFLLPVLGEKEIASIATPELLALLRRIQAAGTIETTHRVKQIAGQIFRYGIATGVCERDLSADLRGALTPKQPVHRASATTPREAADVIRAMRAYQGGAVVRNALWFSAYTFARPGEIRHAEWTEFDIEAKEWRIPAEKMKMRRPHIVPLSDQVVRILEEMKEITGHGRYVFPGARNMIKGDRPMSENAVNAGIRRLGFGKDEMTAHGFRSMASTLLHEQGWLSDAIERQLAHVERNAVKAAYSHAEHLPERRKMMQAYADWLDSLK